MAYLNISPNAKVDKKNEVLKVIVECDNTERLFIATFGLLDVADEMEDLFNASEPNYKEMPDYQDLAYHVDHNDNIQAIENLIEKGNLDLTPYYEPKQAKKKHSNIRFHYPSVEDLIPTYGFVERSDFGDAENVIFEY